MAFSPCKICVYDVSSTKISNFSYLNSEMETTTGFNSYHFKYNKDASAYRILKAPVKAYPTMTQLQFYPPEAGFRSRYEQILLPCEQPFRVLVPCSRINFMPEPPYLRSLILVEFSTKVHYSSKARWRLNFWEYCVVLCSIILIIEWNWSHLDCISSCELSLV